MWSKPIERLNADGSRYHLVSRRLGYSSTYFQFYSGECARTCYILQVLLDTEGIDAYDQVGLNFQVPIVIL